MHDVFLVCLLVLGLVLVAVGFGLFSFPLGVIVAGVEMAGITVAYSRGTDG